MKSERAMCAIDGKIRNGMIMEYQVVRNGLKEYKHRSRENTLLSVCKK